MRRRLLFLSIFAFWHLPVFGAGKGSSSASNQYWSQELAQQSKSRFTVGLSSSSKKFAGTDSSSGYAVTLDETTTDSWTDLDLLYGFSADFSLEARVYTESTTITSVTAGDLATATSTGTSKYTGTGDYYFGTRANLIGVFWKLGYLMSSGYPTYNALSGEGNQASGRNSIYLLSSFWIFEFDYLARMNGRDANGISFSGGDQYRATIILESSGLNRYGLRAGYIGISPMIYSNGTSASGQQRAYGTVYSSFDANLFDITLYGTYETSLSKTRNTYTVKSDSGTKLGAEIGIQF